MPRALATTALATFLAVTGCPQAGHPAASRTSTPPGTASATLAGTTPTQAPTPTPTGAGTCEPPAPNTAASVGHWVTTTGIPAYAQTYLNVRNGAEIELEWLGGSPAAPSSMWVALIGTTATARPCDRATLADINDMRFERFAADGVSHRQHDTTVAYRDHVLLVTAHTPVGTVRLRLTPGNAATFDAKLRRARQRAHVEPLDLAAARNTLRRHGFILDEPSGWPWIEPQFPSRLRAVHGTCVQTGDGHCQNMFFLGHRYLGTDMHHTNAGVELLWQTGDTIALAYPRWRYEDPMCCPGGGLRVVRFHWTGTRLVPLDYFPAEPNA